MGSVSVRVLFDSYNCLKTCKNTSQKLLVNLYGALRLDPAVDCKFINNFQKC